MTTLPHRLDRSVFILAKRDTIFAFFQDNARWASWWGAGSTIDPRPGGKVYVRYPNAVEASGEILEISAPDRIVFSYGYASGQPVGPGESRVTITLTPEASGTRLTLTHELADAAARDQHVQGWRYQLSVFANLVANELHANAGELADAWFSAWAEPDEAARRHAFDAIASSDVHFGDRYSMLDGIDDLTHHAGATQKFMPGMRMHRDGAARHCLGTALVNWNVKGPDGNTLVSGTNVFTLGADGKIVSVVGVQ
jgi:uncharacterized protein YndB with AHSA1/START domain